MSKRALEQLLLKMIPFCHKTKCYPTIFQKFTCTPQLPSYVCSFTWMTSLTTVTWNLTQPNEKWSKLPLKQRWNFDFSSPLDIYNHTYSMWILSSTYFCNGSATKLCLCLLWAELEQHSKGKNWMMTFAIAWSMS